MENISEQSQSWYSQEAETILTPEIKLKLKQEVEQDLLEEYGSVLSKANWFQSIGLNFKLQRLKQDRIKVAFQNYLTHNSHPHASEESLW